MRRLDKKGYSLSGWVEASIFFLLFIVAAGSIFTGMNDLYPNESLTLTESANASSEINEYTSLSTSVESLFTKGDIFLGGDEGVSLESSWGIIKNIVDLIWQKIITGGWIEIFVEWMMLPAYVAVALRLLWFLSIGLIIIALIFKVRP